MATTSSLTGAEDIEDVAAAHHRYAATRDPRLRASLLERYDFVALSVARRFRGRGEPLEDLEQVGRAALVAALDRYDPDRGVAFSTYAWQVATGEIKRYFRDHGWHVRVPRTLQEHFLDVARATDDLTARNGRPPSVEELAAETGLEPAAVREATAARGAHVADSLDGEWSDGGQSHDGDLGVGEHGFERIEQVYVVDALIARLPEHDRQIVRMRYGEELTQAEIGNRIGCSQMHVSRRLSSVHARMRAWARSDN